MRKKKQKKCPMRLNKRIKLWTKKMRHYPFKEKAISLIFSVVTLFKTLRSRFANDPRTVRQRFMFVILPILLFTFTFLFWGAMDTVVRNPDYFDIRIWDIFAPLMLVFAISTICIIGLCLLLRGALFDFVISLLLSLSVAGFIQIMFFNRGIGLLDGEEFYFVETQLAFNSVVWIAIIAGVFILRFFKSVLWKKAVVFLSITFFMMQFAPFVAALPEIVSSRGLNRSTGYFLSIENEFVLSGNENTIVFLVDRLTPSLINDALDTFPHLQEMFRDFTHFANSSSLYNSTLHSLPYLLTRQRWDFGVPRNERPNAWSHYENVNFYTAMREAGYKTHVFVRGGGVTRDIRQSEVFVDNLTYGYLGTINNAALIRNMINLSLFRISPLLFKQVLSPGDVLADVVRGFEYVLDDAALYKRLTSIGLSTKDEYNMFVFYHMIGAHGGFTHIDEFANRTSDSPRLNQTAGALWIIGEYLNQMRQLGIYDSANIIVISDHGPMFNPASGLMIKRAGQQQDAMDVSYAPVCHEDFWPTLSYLMDLNTMDFGRSVFHIPEDEVRERVLISRTWYPGFPYTGTAQNAALVFHYSGFVSDDDLIAITPFLDGTRVLLPGFSDWALPNWQMFPAYR